MSIVRLLMALLLFAGQLQMAEAQAVEVAGAVGNMSGTLVAQRSDGTVKVLAPKSAVLEGDMLITAKNSYAQIVMNDSAKLTLRPNSNLKVEAFQFRSDTPQADNAVLRLLKGGFRTVTGLIGKRGNADAYKVHAATSTIGIRGTDFSARICANTGCQDEDSAPAKPVLKRAEQQVIGRVMLVQADFSAQESSGKVRKLLLGAPVYEGDTLMTGDKSQAVVAFRDESRISLQQNTVFLVEKFKYQKAAAGDNAVLRLLKGGVRVVTGLIGRMNHDDYQFHVANSTIGIRGTGFDSWCNGPCAAGADNPGATEDLPLDGAGVYVWAGEVALVTPGGSFIVAIQQAARIARDSGNPVPILAIPASVIDNATPRPDSIPLDMEQLFGTASNDGNPGLYVTVHDGHVILVLGDKTLDLGRGETGFSSAELLERLSSTPGFMGSDMQINARGGNLNSSNPSMNPDGCEIQ